MCAIADQPAAPLAGCVATMSNILSCEVVCTNYSD